jgi:hypothetical protein
VLRQPVDELGPIDTASGEIQDDVLLIIDAGVHFSAVENEKCLHGGVPHALVAIEERVILDQREAERCRLLNQRGIQIDAVEGSLGLGDRRLKCAEIPDTGCGWRPRPSTPSPRGRASRWCPM